MTRGATRQKGGDAPFPAGAPRPCHACSLSAVYVDVMLERIGDVLLTCKGVESGGNYMTGVVRGRANETSAALPGLSDLGWLRSDSKADADAVFACRTEGCVGVSGEECSGDTDRKLPTPTSCVRPWRAVAENQNRATSRVYERSRKQGTAFAFC